MREEKVVYLSPSAQQYNIGVGDYGTEEYRMNRIADILENMLKDAGYIVYRNNPEKSLKEIVEESNNIKPDIHVALHSNASGSMSEDRGPVIYTNKPNTLGDKLAKDIYNEVILIYPNPELGKGVQYTDSLYELINTTAPSALLEVAFHDNPKDALWIINNEGVIAQAVFDGINKYFENI